MELPEFGRIRHQLAFRSAFCKKTLKSRRFRKKWDDDRALRPVSVAKSTIIWTSTKPRRSDSMHETESAIETNPPVSDEVGPTDAQLLARFIDQRDQAAF